MKKVINVRIKSMKYAPRYVGAAAVAFIVVFTLPTPQALAQASTTPEMVATSSPAVVSEGGGAFATTTPNVAMSSPKVAVATTTPDIATSTTATATTTSFETATIALRDTNQLVGPFTVTLAAPDAPSFPLAATGATTTHDIPARSVLAELAVLDAAHAEFDVTDLQFFPSFNSFLVNCILVLAASSTPDCFNWTYAVNGEFPSVGMGETTLEAGDVTVLVFGSQWRIATDKSTVSTGEPFVVTAEKLDPSTGAYVPATGETVAAVQFDANFNAVLFATSTVDGTGHGSLSIQNGGVYSVGIAASGFFPNSSVTVSTPATPTNQPTVTASGANSSVGDSTPHPQLNIPSALQYLGSVQKEDGSFDSMLLSDWAAIAFSAADPGQAKEKLRGYLLASTGTLSSVTDYERHGMALEALGINPYSGTSANYITPIVSAFDGIQIGDIHLDNDDIFALFPLLAAGYSVGDDLIQKTVAFILSAQDGSGAWDSSVDMTASAIQALTQVRSLPNVSAAISRAENYLHSQQQASGGFENSFSTSWALQAISALGEPLGGWKPGSNTPGDYLASLQQADGGIEPTTVSAQTRIWATEYTVPATLGKAWPVLLQQFAKPSLGPGTSAMPSLETPPPVATSTPIIATSTPVATSTVPVVLAGTSTPPVSLVATSTASAPPSLSIKKAKKVSRVPKVVAKTEKKIEPSLPAPVQTQMAAAASASSSNFFRGLWRSVVMFLRNLL
jgi:hypothetical protein